MRHSLFEETGTETFEFRLPAQMLTGTYYLYSEFRTYSSSSSPFDVAGISAVIKESRVDKERYGIAEPFKLKIKVNISQGFEGRLKAWLVNERQDKIKICDVEQRFSQGINSYKIKGTTSSLGREEIVYGIYLGTNTLVSRDSKEIDVYEIEAGKAKVIERGRFKIEIPTGRLDKWSNLGLEERGDYPTPHKDIKVIKVAEFNLSPVSTRILKPIKVTFDYSELLVAGMIEERLTAYYIVAGSWERIENQEIDRANNRLTFYLPHFSLIGIGTEVVKPLRELKVYPNPAREKKLPLVII